MHLHLVPPYNPGPVAAPTTTREKPRARSPRQTIGRLAYYPRLNLWKNHNGQVTLNPDTFESKSYGWWIVSMGLPGEKRIVLNTYRYSVTTADHIRQVRAYLDHYFIPYQEIEAPRGLQDLQSAVDLYESRIKALKAAIAKPGSRKAKNEERQREISKLMGKLGQAQRLLSRV